MAFLFSAMKFMHSCVGTQPCDYFVRTHMCPLQAQVEVPIGLRRPVWRWQAEGRSWSVSHMDAKRLLTACWLDEQYFDVVDGELERGWLRAERGDA